MKAKSDKMKSTASYKRHGGTFRSGKVNHGPQAKNARTVIGQDREKISIKRIIK
jgi:hypothetical protein